MRLLNTGPGTAMLAVLLAGSLSCGPGDAEPPPRQSSTSPYLYVWAGAEAEGDSDFLAVIDADPGSERYGEILASVAVGLRGGAHHSEHVMPEGDSLFVNSFRGGASFVIDLSDPLAPRVAGSFRDMGEYTYPHTFERLPGGNVLVTFQTRGEGNEIAGGLVELDPAGRLVRASDAADPVDPELRAYSVTPVPRIDRAVSTTSDMWAVAQGRSFQVWRLSDLELLHTVRLPEGSLGHEHQDPAEIRLLPDSTTAIMTTFTCAMYLLHDLETEQPWAELIHVLPWKTYDTDECGIPLTRGRFWIQTHAHSDGSALISMDVSDPSDPVVVDRLTLPGDWWPHWVSMEPGGNRIVLTSGPGTTLYRVLIVHLDPETGRLELDTTFRDAESDVPGVSFDRVSWPHGDAGAARPHGAVFSRVGNEGTGLPVVGLAQPHYTVSRWIRSGRTAAGLHRVVLAAIPVIIPGCGSEAASSDPAVVADSAGVTIVSSGEGQWAADEAWSVSAEPRLILGVLDGAPEYQFSNISAAARQADGDLVVADAGSHTVRLYSADGGFVRLLGGPGSGPGEFQRPTQIRLHASGSILVWDDAAFRLTRYDSAANLLDVHTFSREKIAKAISPPLYPGTAQLLNSSGLLVRLIEKGKDSPVEDRFRGRSGALRVSSNYVVVDTVAWFGDVEQVLVDAPWGRQPVVPPLARNTSIAVQPTGDRVCIGDQNGPEVRCFEVDGQSTSVRWSAKPLPVRDDDPDVARWRATTVELYEPKLTAAEARQLVDQVPTPAFRPDYSGLVLDREGNLWVERGPGGSGSERGVDYLVFNPAGELLGSLAMPPMRVLDIGSDYVLGVIRDELEVQYLLVLEIDKPSTSVDLGSP